MSTTKHHNEWLSLVPNSGPFLSLPVLCQAFPQGLDAHDPEVARRQRMAFAEWENDQLGRRPDPAIHLAWIKFVLGQTLGFDELLVEGQAIPQTLKSEIAEYGESVRPDWIVNDPTTKKARLLVQGYPRSQSLTKPVASSRWKASPDTRMMQLLHDTGIRLGIITNGDQWMLVNAAKNETTGYITWDANLWLDEPVTLRAFRTLLGVDRFFSVPDVETLDLKDGLLDQSAKDQQEVTDQLGYQVRKAVEVLVQALDKADHDHGRKLLADVDERVLYESALTVMMRLVFLFCAEERELLLLGDELYDKNYAVSTLREQLEDARKEHSDDILNLRYDAWARLLSTFRVVYAGAGHDRLKLPPYGGSLFNPDRFPFLEGRTSRTTWKDTEAVPLPISNRTVRHLLEALQMLRVRLPGGGTAEARKLSFRSLDIEQIGHVYEGLLDHTAKRATETVLGLQGTRVKEPEVPLAELERLAVKGEKDLLKFLKDVTGRSESALKKGLNATLDDPSLSRLRTVCPDSDGWNRLKPFAGLLRLDTIGYPVVINSGSVFVTTGSDRRSTGTHYTPRSLTEPIVQYTLEPLVYVGPAEGKPKNEWKLRTARELLELKICDMACGSGAFLVEACRYMSARLLEAWDEVERLAQSGQQQHLFAQREIDNATVVRITPFGDPSKGGLFEQVVPIEPMERTTFAMRSVAQRCLYGVDKNPLAVEMAKLSLWLLTLAKDKPFEFLDHAIRSGDSLVGLHDLSQLRHYSLRPDNLDEPLFSGPWLDGVEEAIQLRLKLEEMPVNTVEDIVRQEALLKEANEKIARLRCAADLLVAAEFWGESASVRSERVRLNAKRSGQYVASGSHDEFELLALKERRGQTMFHWPLEFPEVIVKRGGFDAFVGNPPFMGGKKISREVGEEYRRFIQLLIADERRGSADLCAFFLLRFFMVLQQSGYCGLVATSAISEGDTRELALDYLISAGATIIGTHKSRAWPGVASVTISPIWMTRSSFRGSRFIDDRQVAIVNPYLTDVEVSTATYRLTANIAIAFQGSVVHGEGFVLSQEEASALIAKDERNREVVIPYLRGDDFNNRPDCSPATFVINFRDWPLEKANRYSDCFDLLVERVKPERDKVVARGKQIHEYDFWKFWDKRLDSYDRIAPLSQVLFHCFTSKYLAFAFVPPEIVFAAPHIVIGLDKYRYFGILQGFSHETWVRFKTSYLSSSLRYTPSDCFETFPFPVALSSLDTVPRHYYECRATYMLNQGTGLTDTYNCFHDSDKMSADIQKLRDLHVEMDQAVAAAYGWTDLDLGHGFHGTKQGVRFTISEPARREVLQRLLELNHERYAEEVKQGLHDKGKPKAAKSKRAAKSNESPTLFGMD